MTIEQLYTSCLAEAAYYVESQGEAVIIDPLRDVDQYLELAEKRGARIKYIFETHFHADFVSGHLDLARKSGATIVYGPNAHPDFDFYPAKDEEELELGSYSFRVLHTPGHTMESTTYLLLDENGSKKAIFTGDTLFIGDVGRPDLAVKTDLTEEDLAGHLYDSLRQKIMTLPDEVIVYPGHGEGSACGKNMSSERFDTLGNQKKTNYALRPSLSKEDFIKAVTSGLSAPPQYFPENVKLNKRGYDPLDEIKSRGGKPLTVEEFEEIRQHSNTLVLDTRFKDDFAREHIPGSVFIGIDGNFAPWVGTLINNINTPILIVCDEGRIEEVLTRLSRVGYDNTMGYLKGGLKAWQEAGKETASIEEVEASDVAENFADWKDKIIDLRKPGEYAVGHIEQAINKPLDDIYNLMPDFDVNNTYYVHCKSGYRSLVAGSILQKNGRKKIINVKGGIEALKETTIPIVVTEETHPLT